MNENPLNFVEKSSDKMDKNEIAELAMWTAHEISNAFKESGTEISAIDENFIGQFVNVLIDDWQSGITVDSEHVIKRAMEFDDFKNAKVSGSALQVMLMFAEKFPQFVSLNSPAVKV